ncbi:MAG: electron transport complex subunit RsxE [Nanoarchaeota archaeon]
MNKKEIFFEPIFKKNPIFVQLLGLCPSLAVTNSFENALGMGLATFLVLIMSTLVASLLRNIISESIRIPAFIVVIASFVTLASLYMEAYFPQLHDNLGVYVPLIVVNCLILGRVLSFSYKNKPGNSLLDALGTGIGFAGALSLIGILREILGTGQIELFGTTLMNISIPEFQIMILPPGALLIAGLILAGINYFKGEK